MDRDFKGVWIPKEIWLDIRLNALDKIILTEIDSLDKGEDGCWASNQYIAEFCQCSVSKVSTSISKLIKYKYLYIKSFDGRTRVLKSCLLKFKRQDIKNNKADFKILKETNISNNINNNIINNKEANRFKKPTIDEIKAYCEERNNGINAEAFYDFYESKNWMIGKNKMKDFKACVRTWERRDMNKKEIPSWMNKNIKTEKMTIEEQKELDDILDTFK